MADVRKIPQPDGGRIETGPVQFGDDWPGLFIRGDNAAGLAQAIRTVLDETPAKPSTEYVIAAAQLWSLVVEIHDGVLQHPQDLRQAFKELADAADGRWDGVDADEFVKELREDGDP